MFVFNASITAMDRGAIALRKFEHLLLSYDYVSLRINGFGTIR